MGAFHFSFPAYPTSKPLRAKNSEDLMRKILEMEDGCNYAQSIGSLDTCRCSWCKDGLGGLHGSCRMGCVFLLWPKQERPKGEPQCCGSRQEDVYGGDLNFGTAKTPGYLGVPKSISPKRVLTYILLVLGCVLGPRWPEKHMFCTSTPKVRHWL